MTGDASDLETARREIAEVDRTIAGLILRRLALARTVGGRKAARHEPTRDFVVEAQVLRRWREALTPAGVAPGRAEGLARWLVEESVRVQQDLRPALVGPGPGPADVAIVGGAGAMGSWLAGFFEDAGHRVAVVDPRAGGERTVLRDVEAAASSVDVLVFATPIRGTAPLLRRALATETRALVFDVLSVKAPIEPILRDGARAGRRVTSVHPLFGPSARTLSGRNLLVVSCGVPAADRDVRALFEGSALALAEVPLERHDRLMAESLGLAHAVNLLFLSALAADPASPHELAEAASTTFYGQASLAQAVAREGAELYLDIQALNPHSRELYHELRGALDRLSDLVERRDLAGFAQLLDTGRSKLAGADSST